MSANCDSYWEHDNAIQEHEHSFEELVRDKLVAVVGGGPHVAEGVNDCDLVCQLNSHWLRRGGRMDVLYHHCEEDVTLRLLLKIMDEGTDLKYAWLDRLQPYYQAVRRILLKNRVPIQSWVNDAREEGKHAHPAWLRELIGSRPSFTPLTGIVAVCHFSQLPIRGLLVTGMDMYQGGGKRIRVNSHNLDPQIDFLKQLQAHDSRVIYDRVLNNVVNTWSRW